MDNYLLTKNNFEICTTGAFKTLFDEHNFADVTLACPDEEQVDAHKVILSACSPFFKKILMKNKMKSQLIYLKGILSRDLKSILQFMYTGQTQICKDDLDGFLLAAQELQVEGLVYSDIGDSQGREKGRSEIEKSAKDISKIDKFKDNIIKENVSAPGLSPVIKKEPKTPKKTKSSHFPPKPEFKCEECQLYLQNQNHFDVHNEMLHNKNYSSEERSLANNELAADANDSDKENSFSCETDGCKFVTKNRDDLKAHILALHLGLKKYTQSQSTKVNREEIESISASPDLDSEKSNIAIVSVDTNKMRSVKTETDRKFCCEICDFSTAHKFNLKRHMGNVHQLSNIDPLEKYNDDEKLSAEEWEKKKKRSLGVDLESVDPSQIFSCDKCDFTTTHFASKKRHMLVIHEGLRHPCNFCSFQPTQPYDVKKHAEKTPRQN